MALWASCCTSWRHECSHCVNPSLQSMLCLFCKIKPNGLEKGNLLFCSFLFFFFFCETKKNSFQHLLVSLLSKGLSLFIMPQPQRRDKMPPYPPVPTHLVRMCASVPPHRIRCRLSILLLTQCYECLSTLQMKRLELLTGNVVGTMTHWPAHAVRHNDDIRIQ